MYADGAAFFADGAADHGQKFGIEGTGQKTGGGKACSGVSLALASLLIANTARSVCHVDRRDVQPREVLCIPRSFSGTEAGLFAQSQFPQNISDIHDKFTLFQERVPGDIRWA